MECVIEYMDLGDLRTYLSKHSPDDYHWDQKFESIYSIVHGLVYLHTFSPPIIHRDLKSRNVLVDSVKGTKLTDFGTSKLIQDDQRTMTCAIGTYRWMAPEVLSDSKYSLAADIYSFGIIISEFCTHKLPYSSMSNLQVYHEVMKGGVYPSFDDNAPEWVKDMAIQCLQVNAQDRPTVLELSVMLPRKNT
ncbi:kinase [Thraustotheca clavata]|uniref:Kinase n=1 Tax=Thraustotheca clavata TaxID=74557 RepID=A0A1V9YZG7_9STRA|nr:kinase [Thraustotheca clavata]